MGVEQIISSPLTLLLFAAFVWVNITQQRVTGSLKVEGAAVDMQTAYVRVSDKRMDDLEQRVESLQAQLDIAKKGDQDKSQLVADLQDEVNGLRKEVSQLKDKVNSMDEEKRHLLEENESLRKERDDYMQRALKAEAKATILQDIIDRMAGTKPPTGPLDPNKAPLDPKGTDHA